MAFVTAQPVKRGFPAWLWEYDKTLAGAREHGIVGSVVLKFSNGATEIEVRYIPKGKHE